MKIIPTTYTFDASAKTITCSDFTAIEKLAIITNLTTGTIIYQFNNLAKSGTLVGTTLTLAYDTTAMSDTDDLQIIIHDDSLSQAVVDGTSSSTTPSVNVQPKETEVFAWSFADEVASGVDTTQGSVVITGAGMAVSQTGGNLIVTSGTTAYSETIIRKLGAVDGRFKFKYKMQLSQRIANNNFAVELVDVLGDGLVCENTTATRLIVTLPAHGFTTADIGKSMWVGAITGMSALAQLATINQITDTDRIRLAVTGFPGLGAFGTCSLFGMNYHQVIYSGTTATALGGGYGTSRKGRANALASGTINTTASPGHIGVIDAMQPHDSFYGDYVPTSATGQKQRTRVTSEENTPTDEVQLYVQVRILNGSTAPASTTTMTMGFLRAEISNTTPVTLAGVTEIAQRNLVPVEVPSGLTAAQGGTAALGTSGTGAWIVRGGAVRITDIASAAITTTATSASISLVDIVGSHQFHVDVTATAGTNTFMRPRIQATNDGGTNFVLNIWDFPRIINATDKTHTSPVLPVEFANMRYVRTIGGTTPSVTNSVTRTVRAGGEAKRMRQLNDIELSLTAVAGSTNYLYTAGCTKVQMTCTSLTGMTAPPVLKLQGCHGDPADNTDWFDIPSATLSPSTTTTVASTIYDIPACKFLRYSVTTGGTGTVTALYDLLITSWES